MSDLYGLEEVAANLGNMAKAATQSRMLDHAKLMAKFSNQLIAPLQVVSESLAKNQEAYMRVVNQMNEYNKQIMDIVSSLQVQNMSYAASVPDDVWDFPTMEYPVNSEAIVATPGKTVPTTNMPDVLNEPQNKFWKKSIQYFHAWKQDHPILSVILAYFLYRYVIDPCFDWIETQDLFQLARSIISWLAIRENLFW